MLDANDLNSATQLRERHGEGREGCVPCLAVAGKQPAHQTHIPAAAWLCRSARKSHLAFFFFFSELGPQIPLRIYLQMPSSQTLGAAIADPAFQFNHLAPIALYNHPFFTQEEGFAASVSLPRAPMLHCTGDRSSSVYEMCREG